LRGGLSPFLALKKQAEKKRLKKKQADVLHTPTWRGPASNSELPRETRTLARLQWLMPIILATQEVEIRRTLVRSQPRQIVRETLSQEKPSQKGLVEWLKV
jgi:hypothetical protein